MSTKKNYMNLLKEAISEFDTSKTQSIKGPMLDPILSWEGDGELPTYKDAGSILERYYFNEDNDAEINTLDEADYENDRGGDGKGMKHAQGDAGPQAGTSDKKNIKAVKGEIEDEIDTQGTEVNDSKKIKQELDAIEALGDNLAEADDADDADAGSEEGVNEELEMENEIIEKLIAEMEADDDAQGAGTQQAGTGDADKLVPDRKDEEKTTVKAKNYNEDNDLIEQALAELEDEMADEKDDEKDEEDEETELDVDKKVNEADSAVPGGPSPKKKGEDYEDDEAAYSEAFNLFKEAIEDDVEE